MNFSRYYRYRAQLIYSFDLNIITNIKYDEKTLKSKVFCAIVNVKNRHIGDSPKAGTMRKRRKFRWFLKRILPGRPQIYRRLGIFFLRPGQYCDKRLARTFLLEALRKGDEKAYLIYHRHFSRKKKVIDDRSYREIYRDYLRESCKSRRRRLKEYLKLGTRKQKRSLRREKEKFLKAG